MSALAIQSLPSAAATTLYDAIRGEVSGGAQCVVQLVSCGWGEGAIPDDDATRLFEDIARRRPVRRSPERQGTLPGVPLPEPNLQRVGPLPNRREQRSPDRQASYDRRHRLAYSGVMPPHLAARLTISDMAVMRIVADEYARAAVRAYARRNRGPCRRVPENGAAGDARCPGRAPNQHRETSGSRSEAPAQPRPHHIA